MCDSCSQNSDDFRIDPNERVVKNSEIDQQLADWLAPTRRSFLFGAGAAAIGLTLGDEARADETRNMSSNRNRTMHLMHTDYWVWILLFLLGAYHGVNPAMGWHFAVALGLQKRDSRAVWQALTPIACGHFIAVGLAVLIAFAAGMVIPQTYLKIGVVVLLIVFGLLRILGKGHSRWGGMQVGFKDLTIWSFLTASAHGAGLMPHIYTASLGCGSNCLRYSFTPAPIYS